MLTWAQTGPAAVGHVCPPESRSSASTASHGAERARRQTTLPCPQLLSAPDSCAEELWALGTG